LPNWRVKVRLRVAAIVPAAGHGRRLGSPLPKALVSIESVPLVVRTVRALQSVYRFTRIILPVDPVMVEDIRNCFERYRLKGVLLTAGGRTRAQSVYKAFSLIDPSDEMVLVHDMARPFVSRRLVDETLALAARKGAALAALKATATVKEAAPKNGSIKRTLERDRIYLAQTPQVFRYRLLEKTYRRWGSRALDFTDESSLMEACGVPVYLVRGEANNIKITTRDDLVLAKSIARYRPRSIHAVS